MSYIDPRSKLLQHPGALNQIKTAGRTSAPLNVEVDLSNRCSLGCEWCHFAFTHTYGPLAKIAERPTAATQRGGDLMDTTLAKRMIDQFAEAGVLSVVWTGGGEPTLHRDFNEII